MASAPTGFTATPPALDRPSRASLATAAAALALGVAAAGANATTGADASAQPWLAGLQARSEALNQMYGLGEYATADARSDALNQIHELGPYATTATRG